MKKPIFLFVTLLLLNFAAISQTSCLPKGITFSNQEQIDNFQLNYPGCTEIEGDVLVEGDNITNLDSLGVLTAVWGNL